MCDGQGKRATQRGEHYRLAFLLKSSCGGGTERDREGQRGTEGETDRNREREIEGDIEGNRRRQTGTERDRAGEETASG